MLKRNAVAIGGVVISSYKRAMYKLMAFSKHSSWEYGMHSKSFPSLLEKKWEYGKWSPSMHTMHGETAAAGEMSLQAKESKVVFMI